jgi:hypothetical protein
VNWLRGALLCERVLKPAACHSFAIKRASLKAGRVGIWQWRRLSWLLSPRDFFWCLVFDVRQNHASQQLNGMLKYTTGLEFGEDAKS